MSIDTNNDSTRRKLLMWGSLGSIALLFSELKINKLFSSKKDAISCGTITAKTTKMLTQDGQLVEIDISRLSNQKKSKVTTNQLKTWISKKIS
jgi:hypothetical protein